jgi:glutaredoxin
MNPNPSSAAASFIHNQNDNDNDNTEHPLLETSPSNNNNNNNTHSRNVTLVTSLAAYPGDTLEQQVELLIQSVAIVVIGVRWCPYTRDCAEFLAQRMNVRFHMVHADDCDRGDEIVTLIRNRTSASIRPVIFIRGACVGGIEDVKALAANNDLERYTLRGLFQSNRAIHTDSLYTARLKPIYRGAAMHLPFWYPPAVNWYETRITAGLFCVVSILQEILVFMYGWSRYFAVFLLLDAGLCMLAGPLASPLGSLSMTLVALKKPHFEAGAPRQFAALLHFIMLLFVVAFSFGEFPNHLYVGVAVMAIVVVTASLDCFMDISIARYIFYQFFRFNILPHRLISMYTATRQEYIETHKYRNTSSSAPKPVAVHGDNWNSPLTLRYKKKTDEWSKDDFDPIRHMRISYFIMPLSITGLALAFKAAGKLNLRVPDYLVARPDVFPDTWFQAFAAISAFLFIFMLFLYLTKAMLFFRKVQKEWTCPLQAVRLYSLLVKRRLY